MIGEDKAIEAEAVKVEEFQQSKETRSNGAIQQAASSEFASEDLENAKDVQAINAFADRFPMREVVIKMCGGSELRFNPVTSTIGIVVLWGMAIWCMVNPTDSSAVLKDSKRTVSDLFTWFIVALKPFMTFYLIYIFFRYGHVKLGKKEDEPEFSDATYFAMLFSAGVAVGLFFYGVSEPLWYTSKAYPNYFVAVGYKSLDEIDMDAINLTIFNWGMLSWSPYVLLGIATGLMSYRFDLPMTFRSAFYPLLGGHTFGWIGDILDGFSIVTVVAGVCTSLGLGAIQITQGLQVLGWVDETLSGEDLTNVQAITIWVVTLFSTASVLSGLNVGIKYLSQLAFGLGLVLWFLVLVLDQTSYLLNLIVQATGYYFQWNIWQVAFWTDAFGQLKPGEGRAADGNTPYLSFMNDWINFYSFWFASWAAFVSLFIARISKGRTIRSVIFYSLIGPLIYAILWFCVFGGAGLRSQRRAWELNGSNSTLYNLTESACFDVPAGNPQENISPVCAFESTEQAWFNVMYQYYDFGGFLSVLSLITIGIYFVTSSDSGSLIVDHLASNGHEKHHWLQRTFWALTEGAVATALLIAGGDVGLGALQAASVVVGLPYAFMLAFLVPAIEYGCAEAVRQDSLDMHEEYPLGRSFSHSFFGGVFDGFEVLFSVGKIPQSRMNLGMNAPTGEMFVAFFQSLFVPFLSYFQVIKSIDPRNHHNATNIAATVINAILFFCWIALFGATASVQGIIAFAWLIGTMFVLQIAALRYTVRQRYNIQGNAVFDILTSLFYPQALAQLMHQTKQSEQADDAL